MKTDDFDYTLPAHLIAQTPTVTRDNSRLMILSRSDVSTRHDRFFNIVDYLQDGDILVFNDSRVIPARLMGSKRGTGEKIEILLLRQIRNNVWESLIKPSKRVNIDDEIDIISNSINEHEVKASAVVTGIGQGSIRQLQFSDGTLLPQLGKIPLPPYIHAPLIFPERYQTVYACVDGSAAAPTAGLHFTLELLNAIKQKGVHCLSVTLHVGLDTFQPVREADPLKHFIHSEYGVLTEDVANLLYKAKEEGRRIICVGTTTVRIVEQLANACNPHQPHSFIGWVSLFILPGYQFRMVDALITNFHLPRSTLLMLVTAFTGRDFINKAYQEAIARQYRFYSFGDAMLVL